MSSSIIPARNLEISKLTTTEPRKNAKGGIAVSLKQDGQNLQIRLPKMRFPGGVLVREDEKTGKVDYKLLGSLAGCDPYNQARAGPEAGDLGKFQDFLHDLDDKIIDVAVANSARWFGKTRGKEGVTDSYRPNLTASSDRQPDGTRVPNGKYAPSISLKIPVYDGVVKTSVIDNKGVPIDIRPDTITDVFTKGVEANLVISPSIQVVNQSFGITWRVDYAQVFPTARRDVRAIFNDEIEDDEEETAPASGAVAAFSENPDDAPAPESVKPPSPMPIPAETASAVPSRRRRAA